MHTFNFRAIHKDFILRQRQWHFRDQLRQQFKRHIRLVAAVFCRLIEIGPQCGVDHIQITTNDTVVIQVTHLVQRFGNFILQRLLTLLTRLTARIKDQLKIADQHFGDVRIIRQCISNIITAETATGLAHILSKRAQNGYVTASEFCAKHQAVKAVVFQIVVPHLGKGILE